jgi:hypothetical protein
MGLTVSRGYATASIAIQEMSPWLEYQIRKKLDLSLGELYACMKSLFGERGRGFDDWKGAFSFPLALEVPGTARRPPYVLNVINFRSGVEHRFRKVVDKSDPRLKTHAYYPPDPEEFPLTKMEFFMNYLVGFEKG